MTIGLSNGFSKVAVVVYAFILIIMSVLQEAIFAYIFLLLRVFVLREPKFHTMSGRFRSPDSLRFHIPAQEIRIGITSVLPVPILFQEATY